MAVYGRSVEPSLGWKSVLFCCLGSQNQKKANGSVDNKGDGKNQVKSEGKDGKGMVFCNRCGFTMCSFYGSLAIMSLPVLPPCQRLGYFSVFIFPCQIPLIIFVILYHY